MGEEDELDELSRDKLIDYSVKARGDALKHHRLFKGKKISFCIFEHVSNE